MEGRIFIDFNTATQKPRITIELPNINSNTKLEVRDTLIKEFLHQTDPDKSPNLVLSFPENSPQDNTIAYIDIV